MGAAAAAVSVEHQGINDWLDENVFALPGISIRDLLDITESS
jgi:hypothetical protein